MQPRTDRTKTTRFHGFNDRLRDEAANEGFAPLLFAPHAVQDLSKVKTEQKKGTDFLLHPVNNDGTRGQAIRCENKFEQYASGRITFEAVSVDTNLTPGWMFTSRTAWLLSWFPKSGDLVACPMDPLRDLVMAHWDRHQATTALNRGYASWNALEDVNYVLTQLKDARVLDLRYELGAEPVQKSMIVGKAREKFCKADELVALMRTLPFESEPRAVTSEELVALMHKLNRVNRMRTQAEHVAHFAKLGVF